MPPGPVAVAVAVTVTMELMVQVLVAPVPEAQPDQATDVVLAVAALKVTRQPGPPHVGWQPPEDVTLTVGAGTGGPGAGVGCGFEGGVPADPVSASEALDTVERLTWLVAVTVKVSLARSDPSFW